VRTALRRRWFERRLAHLETEPCDDVVYLGSDYGGWSIPEIVEAGWTCYCVGAGGDISFDRELIQRYGGRVRVFEPDEDYIRRATVESELEPLFSKHAVAVTTKDGPVRMQRTHIPGSRSLSPAGLYDTSEFVEMPGRSIPSLMRELGDGRIDLLKIDVEGGEYELVPTLDLAGLGVRVFCVQLHHTGSVRDARRLIDGVVRDGFRLVASDPVVRLTFVRSS
jgi:FkbM family methyltransferase